MSPLANQDPLAQLNDIIGPTAAHGFPPAPIYWLLILLATAAVVLIYYFAKRYQKTQKKQRVHLAKLAQLAQQKSDFITLNQLLKACALSYFPRSEVASLHGEQWFDFLQQYSNSPLFNNKQQFMQRLYQTDSQANNQQSSETDFIEAKKWIYGLPKQIKKAQKNV